MFWYVLHTKQAANQKLLEAINRCEDMHGFMPMIENWFQGKGIREDQLKSLYPNYIFIKSSLDEEALQEKYKEFFQAIQGLENQIVKIDCHKRTALLDNTFLGQRMILPLEVVNRRGSVSL